MAARRNEMKKIFGMGAMLALLAIAPAMKATTITYTLTQDGCTGGCGTGPFGTIQLTDSGAGSTIVAVLVTLAPGERFAGTGAGDALEFNVAGSAVTISGFTSGFGIGPAPDTASVFGTFLQSVTCTACTGGNAGNPTGPLSFMVSRASGITVNSFTANAGGFFFTSDIVGASGNPPPTGNVAAIGTTSTVPEPISSALVGGGLLSLFLLRRRASK